MMGKNLSEAKLKNKEKREKWWLKWGFVVMFSVILFFVLAAWKIIVGILLPGHWASAPLSIFFLFAFLFFVIALLLAVSERGGDKPQYVASMIVLGIGSVIAVLGYQLTQHSLKLDWYELAKDFYANISAEMVSIAITVLVIENLSMRLKSSDPIQEEAQQKNNDAPTIKPKPESVDALEKHPSKQNCFEKGILVGAFFAIIGVVFGYFLGQRD